MSLLSDAFEDFIIVNKAVVNDGYGGIKTTWTEGATIQGVMSYNSSDEMRIAQSLGSKQVYVFTCRRDLTFDYHNVLKRVRDDQLFRITTNSDDNHTPNSAGLDMRQYDAEQLTALPE